MFLYAALGLSAQTARDQAAQVTSALHAEHFEQAVRLADKALTSFPNDPQLWTLKAIGLSAEKKSQEALVAYHHALKISPNYLPALEGAAQIDYDTGEKEAATLLRRIAQLRPSDPTSHAMLGALAYKRGDCAETVHEFELSQQLIDKQAGALQEYGACLLRLRQFDKAISIFEGIVSANPNDPRAIRALAFAQVKADRPRDALATLRPLIDSPDADAATLQLAASAYEGTGDTPEAVKLLRDAIINDPHKTALYVDFANLAFAHQSFQAGIEMMNSGLKFEPNAAPLYLARGVLYVQVGNFEQAEADFDRAEELDPNQPAGVAQGLAAEERHQDDPDVALAVVRSKLAKNPTDPFLHYLQAAIIQQKAPTVGSLEFQRGVQSAKKAIALQPSLASAHDVLASFYLQAGNTELAIAECRAALEHNPKDQTAMYRLIVALRKRDRKAEIPDILKRLAQARQEATKKEAEDNRYKLVVDSPTRQ